MYYGAARKKVIKPRFYVICAVLLIAIGVGLYFLLRPEKSEMVLPGTGTFDLSVRAVVVRAESVFEESKYGHILYRAREGQIVQAGAPVARIYGYGYTEDIMQELFDVEGEILAMQEERLSGIATPELDEINARIADLINEARAICSGKDTPGRSMLDVETELTQAMAERAALLRTTIQPAPTELEQLFEKEAAAKETLSSWAKDIVADSDGMVSYYFDKYELPINANKIDILTPALIEEAINDRSFSADRSFATSSGDKSYVYKLVDPNHWYIAFVTKNTSYMRLTQGESYRITFKGYETTPYNAKAVTVRAMGDKIVNILEFTDQPIGDFLSIRAVEVTVNQEFTGHKVLSKAVHVVNGVPYVKVIKKDDKAEAKIDVAVDVLAKQGEYCIVRPREIDAADPKLKDGIRYVLP